MYITENFKQRNKFDVGLRVSITSKIRHCYHSHHHGLHRLFRVITSQTSGLPNAIMSSRARVHTHSHSTDFLFVMPSLTPKMRPNLICPSSVYQNHSFQRLLLVICRLHAVRVFAPSPSTVLVLSSFSTKKIRIFFIYLYFPNLVENVPVYSLKVYKLKTQNYSVNYNLGENFIGIFLLSHNKQALLSKTQLCLNYFIFTRHADAH